ncbi:helix-turn-helix transcriptional regulator [Nocardia terpenica]|uniref:helix-turn-helix domain-containing protein n=1 Tax=Nocardia terpenica TaxID=455432 RepID=UPI001894C244|nr:helix-turn-helix transcriptional regulator [Nocardia terpenica]MBF6062993.1 helix-turn-helix transcriptional regulator [Nocardia terpenica]MBF6104872.1 helix-turn-helix transcriptional regulator [Nocardia terpenica]MBF6112691.1 helix-turn-helix transcriptional regulator [Nocardia terpenica]MBF6118600.1 helix-turn-helix transcriptional regulator [Nocardia terpenica]MBF6155079.1 helix-turn-helix transcriptional regulator [Nocardia terpenica]
MTTSSAGRARESLGNRLREIRLDAKLTARQLATLAGWHHTKVSKHENGHRVPSLADLELWCHLCNAEDLLPDLLAATREIEKMYVQLRRLHRTGTARYQQQVLREERQAKRHRIFCVSLIPGPAQTPEYATAVLTDIATMNGYPSDDILATVAIRMERAELLRSARVFHMILCENVLRVGVVPPEVAVSQLEHLLTIMDYPRVRLGVLPTGERQYMPVCEFWITDDTEVEIETYSAILRTQQPSEVAIYTTVFEQYARQAHYGKRARAIIQAVLDDLRQHRSTS